jgi:hypothetical protein
MATIVTTASLKKGYDAFTGLSSGQRTQSGIPRAQLVYTARSATWAAPGAGNDRQLQFDMTLDTNSNYGFVLTDCFVRVENQAAAGTVECSAIGAVDIFPGGNIVTSPWIPTRLISQPSRQNVAGNTAIGTIDADYYNSAFVEPGGTGMRFVLEEQDKPKALIYPYESVGSSSYVRVVLGELAINGAAYVYDFYCRFLQFDIDQSYNYVLNTPQLTR